MLYILQNIFKKQPKKTGGRETIFGLLRLDTAGKQKQGHFWKFVMNMQILKYIINRA